MPTRGWENKNHSVLSPRKLCNMKTASGKPPQKTGQETQQGVNIVFTVFA